MAVWAESVLRFFDWLRSAVWAVSQGGILGASNQFLDDVAAAIVVEPV
jgi:hypothetical protein